MLLVSLHTDPATVNKSMAFLRTHNSWLWEGRGPAWDTQRDQPWKHPVTQNQGNAHLDVLFHKPAAVDHCVSLTALNLYHVPQNLFAFSLIFWFWPDSPIISLDSPSLQGTPDTV